MKQTLLLWAMSLFGIHTFAGEVILESGETGKNNFNGWYISPFTLFSSMDFQEDYVEFISENGGEISIELMRKIPMMADFEELIVEFRFAEMTNSILNTISIYASSDGKHWNAIPEDATYKAVRFANPDYSYQYLKAVANVTFFQHGRVRWNYSRIEGQNTEEELSSGDLSDDDAATTSDPKDLTKETFNIFGFEKVITVKSPSDKPYKIMVTNMSGKIVHYEKIQGDKRIDTDFPYGLYMVHILQNDEVVAKQKIVL